MERKNLVAPSEQRRRLMQSVRRKHTKPELIVRKTLRQAGYRYRLHTHKLPGTPDIVFPGLKRVIFVHGCFWHRHNCKKASSPKSNQAFWTAKFLANKARDRRNIRQLKAAGYSPLIVWECEISNLSKLERKLSRFLQPPKQPSSA